MTIRSTYPDIAIPDVSIYDFLFADLSDEDRGRVAIVDGISGAETTYGQLKGQVDAFAGALAARGIGVGDVVALHAPNVPIFVSVFHGILRAGATVTTVNALYTGEELGRQLVDSGARLLITVSPLLEAAKAGAAAAGLADDQLIVLDASTELSASGESYASARDLLTSGAPLPEVSFDPATHLAVLPYSSGTTGRPKGVELTHRNLVANVSQAAPLLEVTRDEVIPAILPFFHIYGLTVLLNLSVLHRSKMVTLPRFDLVQYLQVIQDHRATFLFIAPPIGVALAKHPIVDQYDLSSVTAVLSGAAPFDENLGNAIAARLKTSVLQGYGMSEMSPVSHLIPRSRTDISPGSIGVLIPNMEVKLVDPITGDEILPEAEGLSDAGELLCRGPNVMVGYLGNADATAETIEPDGFLHTGDIARVAPDGTFYIVDRLKELIKYKGYQVPPAELEALLLTHPAIADAAVIGIPDEEAGEVPKAFVVLQPGAELAAEDVIAFVAGHVAPHKKVRAVEFIEKVPKSSSGKILRKDLRAPVSA